MIYPSEIRRLRKNYSKEFETERNWPFYPREKGANLGLDLSYKLLSLFHYENPTFSANEWLNSKVSYYLDLFGPGHLDLFNKKKSKLEKVVAVTARDTNTYTGNKDYRYTNIISDLYNPLPTFNLIDEELNNQKVDLITCTPFGPFMSSIDEDNEPFDLNAKKKNYLSMLRQALKRLNSGGILISQLPSIPYRENLESTNSSNNLAQDFIAYQRGSINLAEELCEYLSNIGRYQFKLFYNPERIDASNIAIPILFNGQTIETGTDICFALRNQLPLNMTD